MKKSLNKTRFFTTISTLLIMLLVTVGAALANTDIMTKEQLKKAMDEGDVIVLDVRRGKDWSASEFKIRGALRADPSQFSSWADQYPKNKTIVLYCA